MRPAAFAALFALAGCVTTNIQLTADQQSSVSRRLEGEDRYLKLSFFSTPFYGDKSKHLLTPVPPDQTRLLDNPNGTPIEPGETEAIFPAGTLVRIKRVEFPSSLVLVERVAVTPRTFPWIYLDVAGTPKNAQPYVLVLRPDAKNDTDFLADVERYLTKEDPAPSMAAFSDAVKEAVKAKRAVVDMPAAALEMAWGYPEQKKITLEGNSRRETWTWPGGKRVAMLVDGKVSELP
jgi:hypothetical protein